MSGSRKSLRPETEGRGEGQVGRGSHRMSVSQVCAFRREVKDGTCLGQLTLPSSWWMPFTQQLQKKPSSMEAGNDGGHPEAEVDQGIMKHPKVFVDVKYSVFETIAGASCHQDQGQADGKFRSSSMHTTA